MTETQGTPQEWMDVRILRRIEAAQDIVALELARTDGQPLPAFEAGAHVDVLIAPGLVRQYSLCNDPAERERYMLGILLDKQSRGGSKAVHSDFREGAEIKISAPRNAFALRPDMRHAVLLAGGIGITPIKAMAHALHRQGTAFELHYCARSRRNAAFLDELLAAPFGARVTCHLDDECGGPRPPEAYLPNPGEECHLYICGPGGFIDAVRDKALASGWPDACIHLERFVAAPAPAGDSFTVEAVRSGVTVQVGEDESIAHALMRAGLDVLTSCEQGLCGVCLTEIVEGVPVHHDQFQTDEEKAANTHMTICCSRAKTPIIKLDI